MEDLNYIKELAGVPSDEKHLVEPSVEYGEVLEEGVARTIDFKKVQELFNATYSSSWYNKNYRGLRFDKGYVQVMGQAKFRTINLSKVKPATLKYFEKLVTANVYDPLDPYYADIFDAFKNKGYLNIAFFVDKSRGAWLKFFNAKENDQQEVNVFNVNVKKFKELANKAGFKIVPSEDIQYEMKSMKFNKDRKQIEITMKDSIMITHENYAKTKQGTPKNTLIVSKSGENSDGSKATGYFTNFYTTYQSESPKKKEDDIVNWLKKHVKGFKLTDFRKMLKAHMGEVQDNFDMKNSLEAAVSAIRDEIGNDVKDHGSDWVLTKRWHKVDFEFRDDDIVDQANWFIERKLTEKSAKFLDSMVAKLEKRFKGRVEITWHTEEKWHVYFNVRRV